MNTKNMPRVVMVGSIGLDTIETPLARREDILGGSVSYACVACSRFVKTGMVGIVGTDFPEAYTDLYRSCGIDLAGLQRVEGKTFRWSGVYDADMINRRTRSTDLNVFADFSPELPDAYRSVPFVLLGNIGPELQLHVLDQVPSPEFVVADTMDLWINHARQPLEAVIRRVDMLMLNDSEARLLTGEANLRRCAGRILAMGPRYVVIKKGEHGAMLFSKEGIFLVPAYPVENLQDPTGAGDSFAGAFIGALAQADRVDDRSVRRALLYGSVIASIGVEAFSLDRLIEATPEAVEERFESFKNMLRF